MDRELFWRDPYQADSDMKSQDFYPYTLPEFYLDKTAWSDIINNSIRRYARKAWSILDLGCGTGRGLADLYRSGYYNLSGIDINCYAINLGKLTYRRDLAGVSLACASVEELFSNESGVSFDLIYSVGCLMHLPYEYDWIFERISNSAIRMIITAENEMDANVIKYPRDYREIFTKLGWKQIDMETGDNYPPINKSTIKRVFTK